MKKVFITGKYQIFIIVPDTFSKEDAESYVINNLEVNDGDLSFSVDWASANVEE